MSEKPQHDDEHDDDVHSDHGHAEGHEGSRLGLRRRLGRLLDRRDLAEDTQSMIGGVLDVGDRAKTEVVRLMAREVRNYLDEMKVKEEVMELITSHSLEMKLSLHLKPLAEHERKPRRPPPQPAPAPVVEAPAPSSDADEHEPGDHPVEPDPTEEAPLDDA